MTSYAATRNIQVIYDYLKQNGPWKGYGTDLAYKLGLSYQDFRIALSTVRSKDWIENEHWTIPFVGQGAGRKVPYMVVDDVISATNYLASGNEHRGKDLFAILRNYDWQVDFGIVSLDGRTAEGKWNKLASSQIKAMLQMAEALGLKR